MSKPRIILHLGFPKCATSSLQRLFAIHNHQLAKSMGITTLGRGFLPDNGYPEVSKLMYERQWCIDALNQNVYPDGRYFLSNEALAGAPDFVKAIMQIFQIESAVFTTRLPSLQAVSNYCFSGWLTDDYSGLETSRNFGVYSASSRMRGKLNAFKSLVGGIKLCPIEDMDGSLNARFCNLAFGAVPSLLDSPAFSKKVVANRSLSLGFADALRRALNHLSTAEVAGPQRQMIVKNAHKYFEHHDLPRSLPIGFSRHNWERLFGMVEEYKAMLLDYGTDIALVSTAAVVSKQRITEFLDQPVCGKSEDAILYSHAIACVRESFK
jgi:hypothetical protein